MENRNKEQSREKNIYSLEEILVSVENTNNPKNIFPIGSVLISFNITNMYRNIPVEDTITLMVTMLESRINQDYHPRI